MSEGHCPWWDRRRREGFRFPPADALVVAACGALTWVLWMAAGRVALLCPIVLGHFFVFCDVLRIGTRLELLWTAALVINVGVWVLLGAVRWPAVVLAQSPVTLLAVAVALCRRSYHGLGFSLIRSWRSRSRRPTASGGS